jgi:hypothetical protein
MELDELTTLKGYEPNTMENLPEESRKMIDKGELLEGMQQSQAWAIVSEYITNQLNNASNVSNIITEGRAADDVKIDIAKRQERKKVYEDLLGFIHRQIQEANDIKISLSNSKGQKKE